MSRLPRPIILESTYTLLAIVAALGVGALLIAAIHINPVVAYTAFLINPLSSADGVTSILSASTPLLLIGLGAAACFRAGIWNIGAEGQMAIGALFAALVGLDISLPTVLHVPLLLIMGMVGGMLVALVAAVLKVKFNANEIVVTLMLNYAMLLVLQYVLQTLLATTSANLGFVGAETGPIAATAILPNIIPGTSLHAGVVIALLCAPLIYLLIFRTSFGFGLRVLGSSVKTARYAGISIPWTVVLTMAIGGVLAGLAGAAEVAGVHYRLIYTITSGLGYTGVLVAVLGRLHPAGVAVASVLFGWLTVGGEAMQSFAGVPSTIVIAIQGIVVLFVLTSDLRSLRRYFRSIARVEESE